jgi:NAD(P)H dehydrogenase (quinone)
LQILVTGATGQLGSKVVDELVRRVAMARVGACVRNPERADLLRKRGVEIRQGDFDDPASLGRAFAGVERLLIVSTGGENATRIRQHRNAVAQAERAGVRFIAYTSLTKADSNPMALGAVHRDTENAIQSTGIPYCVLPNNWYLENEAASIRAAAAGAPLVTAAGDGRIGWVTRDDLAMATAAVLAGSGHENTIYELSGPPRTYADLAGVIASVAGREAKVEQVDLDTYERMLAKIGLPAFAIELIVDAQRAMRRGALDMPSRDLERLLGQPVTPLKESVARLLAAGTGGGP